MVHATRDRMTSPRRVIPGDTLMFTRRCLGRRLRLVPSKLINQLFAYLVAVTSERYGILVHCYCVLSNHFHLIATDPLGTSPAFMRDLCALLARSVNALQGTWETFWAPGSYSAVTLCSREDILEKMAYVLANPVAAGLVPRASEWPGAWTEPGQIGASPSMVERPEHFFRKDGPLPEVAALSLVIPPGFASPEELRAQLEPRVAKLEELAQRKVAEGGRSFVGARKVQAKSPYSVARSEEPRRGLRPRVAAADRWKRVEALGRLKGFLRSYREAWAAFASGVRDAVFPHGTYWMKVAYGVACAGPD